MPRFIQVREPGASFELVERPRPTPGDGEVLLRVLACGLCGGDEVSRKGMMPGIKYPVVPGHEVVGKIDELGPGLRSPERWQVGALAGCGWHAGHCLLPSCPACRSGNFISCHLANATGATRDGGLADYVVVRESALVLMPEGVDALEAAPMLCAGLTVFNCIRHGGALLGDVVAVAGIGGLGHLAIQFCRAAGFNTVAISSSTSKRELALQLGAHSYIDTSSQDVVASLRALGGAKLIIMTAPSAALITSLCQALSLGGNIMVVSEPEGATAEIQLIPLFLSRASITGWTAGIPSDSEECLKAAKMLGVKCWVERWPLEKAEEAYVAMGKARFRHVIDMTV